MNRETTADGIAIVVDETSYDRAIEDACIIVRVFPDNEALAHVAELLRRCEIFEERQGWTDRHFRSNRPHRTIFAN
jgi:hypothetical protein